MKVVVFIILCSMSLVTMKAQKTIKTNEIVTKEEKVKLNQLILKDTLFITIIDSLSQNTIYPLNFSTKKNDILYLNILSSCQNSSILYSIYVTMENKFVYRKGIWGFFEIGEKMFVIQGGNIPELFKLTGKSKAFDYTTSLGYKMTDGSLLPMIATGIDDSQIALLYTYTRGKVELRQLIEGY